MPLSTKTLLADMGVQKGNWIIQNAANGVVRRLLNRFAGEMGVNVLNLVRRDAGIYKLASIGIGNAVSTETEGWRERVQQITGGAPILHGVDSIGGDGPETLLSVMAERAEVISFGNLSGQPLRLSSDMILFKQAAVRGFWAVRPRASQAAIQEMISDLVALAEAGKLVLPVEATYDLAQIREAVRAHHEPGRTGKIALVP